MIPLHQFESFFGLAWNPFLSEIPTAALFEEEHVSQFCWGVERLVIDGGYALVHGDPGSGKSVVMRILQSRLAQIPELCVRTLQRPQSRIRDFYREMASLFGVNMQTSNRFGSFHNLREQWLSMIQTNLFWPVLIVDEAQEVPDEVLAEMRLLGSTDLDARCVMTTVNQLLTTAMQREARQVDENLYFEVTRSQSKIWRRRRQHCQSQRDCDGAKTLF